MTPRVIAVKCPKMLAPATASTSPAGAQPRNSPSTVEVPAAISTNTSAAVTTKAMTWFLVAADTAAPIARIAPAISQLAR